MSSTTAEFISWFVEQAPDVQMDIIEYAGEKHDDGRLRVDIASHPGASGPLRVLQKAMMLTDWRDDEGFTILGALGCRPGGAISERLTVDQAATIYGVTRKTLYNWIDSGRHTARELGRVDVEGGRAYFDAETVIDFATRLHWAQCVTPATK